jgi:hypothetical protein
MNLWIRDAAIALTITPLLIACVLFPAVAGVGVVVLAAVIVGFVLGRAAPRTAPALPQVDTVDGSWREI